MYRLLYLSNSRGVLDNDGNARPLQALAQVAAEYLPETGEGLLDSFK